MKLLAILLLACMVPLPARAAQAPEPEQGDSPLLALARTAWEKRKPDDLPMPGNDDVRATEHEIAQARVPPDAQCARGLGAQRFAVLHLRLGHARLATGDSAGAATAFNRALACRPRDAFIFGRLAEALFAGHRYDAARAAVEAGLALEPRSAELYRQAGTLDFVAGSWAAAAARFRYVAAGEPDRPQAEFAQLMFWLAQRRAGVPQPQFVERIHDDEWPRPLARYLQGELTEANLTQYMRSDFAEDDDEIPLGTSDRLCQALFYVGEAHWARGDTARARDYLAAAINLQVFDLAEHQLALAEIVKLR